jgi:thymidylate synthase
MVAQQCDLEVGELIYTIGDAHIYLNHLTQIEEQLARDPYPLPSLQIKRRPPSIFDYEYEDFQVVNYKYHPSIKAPVAV